MNKRKVPLPDTIVSAPLRGANQDQSGFSPNRDAADYTISDGVAIAGVGPITQTPFNTRQTSHTGDTKNAPHYTPADLERAAALRVRKKDEFARAQQVYNKKEREDKIVQRTREANKRQKERERNMSKPSYVKEIVEQRVNAFTWNGKPSEQLKEQPVVATPVPETLSVELANQDLDEAKRGRPRKNASEEEPEHEHIVMQLRKAVSLRGNYPITFANGKKSMLSQQSAQRLLDKHNDLRTSIEKDDFAKHIAKSADHLRDTLQGKPIPKEKKTFLPPMKSLGEK